MQRKVSGLARGGGGCGLCQDSAADALVTACCDDTYIQGSEEAVIAGAARIMSRHACQRHNTLVSCAETDKAHHVAATLGATVAPEGLVACVTATGHAHSIEEHVQHRYDRTCERVETLVGLPLDPQTKRCVLHNGLHHPEARMLHNSLWVILVHQLRRGEDVLRQEMCDIVGLPQLTALQREHFNEDVGRPPRGSRLQFLPAYWLTAEVTLSGALLSWMHVLRLRASADRGPQ